MLDEGADVSIVTDGPAIGSRSARHALEVVVRRAIVGRGDDQPPCPVPVLDEGLVGAHVGTVTDGPAIRSRSARHALEDAEAIVGLGDD